MKVTLWPAPTLNVCQLMIAWLLDWLTTTAAPPWPAIVAAPPTTVPPSGPAAAGRAPSAKKAADPSAKSPSAESAVVVSRNFETRGCIAVFPLKPSAEDEEKTRVPAHALVQLRHRLGAGQTLALHDLCNGQISG